MIRFVPPVLLMGFIFFLSAQPGLSSGLGGWDLILRKLAHMIVFGLLALLWYRALAPSTGRALTVAAVIALLYAVTDEFHQSFVADRSGSPIDVGIDAVGIGIALLAMRDGRLRRVVGRPARKGPYQPR